MSILEKIKSEEFYIKLPDFPAKAMRVVFLKIVEYDEFKSALEQGILTDDSLRSFVTSLLRDFRAGERFLYDYTLAFLAVCVEKRSTSFAKEYLEDLAALHLAEMPLAPRVARESLVVQRSLTNNIYRTFRPLIIEEDLADMYSSVGLSGQTQQDFNYGPANA